MNWHAIFKENKRRAIYLGYLLFSLVYLFISLSSLLCCFSAFLPLCFSVVCFSVVFASLLFCFSVFFVSLLLDFLCCSAWLQVQLQLHEEQNQQHKQQEQQIQKEQREQQTKQEQQELQENHEQLQRQPCPPPAVSILLLCAFVFALVLVSLRWSKDHDVNELVKKLRFHNASNINQNGKPPCNMEGWSSNMLQISCNMKGSIFQCRRCHAKWEVLSPQCRLASQNAENIIVLAYRTSSVVCFSAFLALMVSPVSFFLALQSFTGFLASWLCLCSPVHCNQSHKRKESQTRPTPKQRPQHQQLLVFLQLHHPQQQPQQQQQQQKQQQQRQQLQLLKTTTCK